MPHIPALLPNSGESPSRTVCLEVPWTLSILQVIRHQGYSIKNDQAIVIIVIKYYSICDVLLLYCLLIQFFYQFVYVFWVTNLEATLYLQGSLRGEECEHAGGQHQHRAPAAEVGQVH